MEEEGACYLAWSSRLLPLAGRRLKTRTVAAERAPNKNSCGDRRGAGKKKKEKEKKGRREGKKRKKLEG